MLFTIDVQKGTTEYQVCQKASEEDEELAKSCLVERAKEEGMVEWFFRQKKYDYILGEKMVLFSIVANPFYSENQKELK